MIDIELGGGKNVISFNLIMNLVKSSYLVSVTFVFKRRLSTVVKHGRRGPAYFHNPGCEPLRPITIGQLIDLAAEKWPNRPAIISTHEGKSLTFSQVKDQSEQLGANLLKLGLRPGDRLGILGANSIHWYLSINAAAKAGLIAVTLNPAYRPLELGSCLEEVGCRALITDHRFKTQDYPEMLAEIAPGIKTARHGEPLSTKQLPDLSYVIVATNDKLPGCYRLDDILNIADSKEEIEKVNNAIQPDDPACIQFSSGTTGKPKATVLTHFGTVNNGHFFGLRCGFNTKHHTLCHQVPLFHIFGSTLGVLTGLDFGNTLVLPGPSFKTEDTVKTLLTHRCNAIYGTPTMYVDVCAEMKKRFNENPELRESFNHFEVVVSGGAICPPKLYRDIADTFNCTNLRAAYGLTETSPICMTNTQNDTFEQKTETVGCCIDHLEIKVVDTTGKMVEFGTPGEAWYRSYGNLLYYWRDEKKTKEAKTESGWFKSGDIMILTEDGYGRIVGRIKDIIIRGGENIFPSEIENFLVKHPEIADIQVYGVSDSRLGEEVAASVLVKGNCKLTAKDIQDYCKGKISHFKIPRYIRFVSDFPKTPSGKIRKNVLKETHEKELIDTSA